MGVAVGGAVGAVVEWLAEVSLSSHLFLSPLCATGAPVSLFLHLESVLFPGMQAEPVLFLLATILYLESLKMNHLRLGMIESEELFLFLD